MMGVCKAALDASVKYLAYDLGPKKIRVNALSAGPVKTLAASAVGDSDKLAGLYELSSPMDRNINREEVGAAGMFLLSDLASGITGEVLHVDCGYNVMGAPGRAIEKTKALILAKVNAANPELAAALLNDDEIKRL
jgi:enoyl-[acyl-carrier protein] reductase I